jgi:hypothetical protein
MCLLSDWEYPRSEIHTVLRGVKDLYLCFTQLLSDFCEIQYKRSANNAIEFL